MKLSRILIDNFQGVRHFDVTLTAPVLLVAGHNHAGKSSLVEAIRIALTGMSTRVDLKKEYGQMVSDGAKTGKIAVWIDGTVLGEIKLPSGEWGEALPAHINPPLLDSVLTAQRFASSTPDERRSFLFNLTGYKAPAALVGERLKARGADEKRIEAVLPLLRSGFPEASKNAADRAREAKGAWRGVTGETYGEKKAEDWKAEAPEVDEKALATAAEALEIHDRKLNDMRISLGVISERFEVAQRNTASIQSLQEKAELLERRRAKLAKDEEELAHWSDQIKQVEDAKVAASGLPCPCCQTRLVVQNGALVEVGEAPAVDVSKLGEYQKARDSFARAVENDKRDVADSEGAAERIKTLQESMPKEVPTQEQLNGLRNELRATETARLDLVTRKNTLVQAMNAAQEAEQKTAAAARHHADVLGWLLIADALASDGIPGELLQEAITPVNDLLHSLSEYAGWKRVQIGADMEVSASGRGYHLLSESEKWRVDAVIAIAIAKLSGVRMVVLDRFDVLDLESRPQLIDLLDWCVTGGALESAVITATMKTLPSSEALGPLFQGIWLGEGRVAEITEQAA